MLRPVMPCSGRTVYAVQRAHRGFHATQKSAAVPLRLCLLRRRFFGCVFMRGMVLDMGKFFIQRNTVSVLNNFIRDG